MIIGTFGIIDRSFGLRKSKTIRQLATGRGKMTNTGGQVGDVEYFASHHVTRLPRTAAMAKMALVAVVATMALVAPMAEMDLVDVVTEIA